MKKEYILLGLIIIALSVYLVLRKTDRTVYELPPMPPLEKKEITRIEIERQETSITLERKDDSWYIEPQGYPADDKLVDSMLEVFENLRLTALVSESKNYARYELDDAKKIDVKAWQSGTLKRDFDIGKAASSYRHTFVKLADHAGVFHAQENFRNKFEVSVEGLRDKVVLAFDPNDIQSIEMQGDEPLQTFSRVSIAATEQENEADQKAESRTPVASQTVWQTADGKEADTAALEQWLQTLSNLRCDSYIDAGPEEAFGKPQFRVQLSGAQEHQLAVYAKRTGEDTRYPATSSGSDYTFYLSQNQADRIMKQPAEFLPSSEDAAADSEQATTTQ